MGVGGGGQGSVVSLTSGKQKNTTDVSGGILGRGTPTNGQKH